MVYAPFIIKNLDFINEKFAQLEKNILILSKEQINDLVREIHNLVKHEYFEISVLNKLLIRIKKKKESEPQELYEKLSFIEKKIKQRIHAVQKRGIVYNGLRDLWKKFDPLNVCTKTSHIPHDHYDAYIFPVFKLLEKKISFDELYQYIHSILETDMTIDNFNKTDLTNFVHELQKWHNNYKATAIF